MKTFLRLAILSIFCLGTLVNTNLVYGSTEQMQLDKSTNTIIAPEATNYVWYLNGTQLENTGRKIDVSSSGVYHVMMTDENGELKSASISVGVNADGETYRIIITGDSTVQAWGGGYYPQEGWGATLQYFFDNNVTVINRARSARSAKSYYNEADWWPVTKAMIQPGDFVLIGFGINDANSDTNRFTLPMDTNKYTGYKWYLKQYIKETQALGAFPVIVTTARRCSFNADGTVYDSWHDYPVASRQMAHDYHLPYIDLDSASVPLYEDMGYEYTAHFIHNVYDTGEYSNYPVGKSDMTHFQESGCVELCRLVTDEIKKYENDTTMNRLIPHIKPQYEVTTSTNFPELAQITRTQSFPQGAPVTVKVRISDTIDLLRWENGDGITMSKDNVYRFTMDSGAIALTAIIDDDPQPDCNGEWNGEAYIDDCGECVEGLTKKLPCNYETPEGAYRITNLNKMYCIQAGDTTVTQEYCENESSSQFWELIKEGKYYKIKNSITREFIGYTEIKSSTPVSMGTDEVLWRMEKSDTNIFRFFLVDSIDIALYCASKNVGELATLNKRNTDKRQLFLLTDSLRAVPFDEIASEIVQFQIKPNPALGKAILELSYLPEHPVSFELYDMQGKRVFYETNITDQRFEFGYDLAKGIYVAKVVSGEKVKTLKFIKY